MIYVVASLTIMCLFPCRNCDAATCLCPRGRDHSKAGTSWELVKCQTCGQSGVHVECGKLVLRSPVYVCSTCQPSTEEDSDEDDEALQQRLERHEARRQELLARKEKIIQDERERLAGTKKKQDEMIQRIKAIFAPDPAERNPEIEYCGRREGAGVQMVNRMTGNTVSLLPPPAPPQAYRLYPGRPRTAQGLPRKAAEPDTDCNNIGKQTSN